MDRGPSSNDSRAFWDRRGAAARPTDPSLTMMMNHRAFADYIHRREISFLRRTIERLGRPRTLDVGCGAGRLELAIAPLCERVVGFDVAPSLIDRAREAGQRAGLTNVEWAVAAAGSDALPPGEFDLVLLSGVLNSLDDDACRSTLRLAHGALRAGGLVYMRNNCANRSRFDRVASDGQAPVRYRTGEEYMAMLRESGFAIEREAFLFAPFCWPNLAYYHAVPRAWRDGDAARRVFEAWFSLEEQTSPLRLALLGELYPRLLRLSRKPTSFRIGVGRKLA